MDEKKINEPYLNFPINLLMETYDPSKCGWDLIIGYGIVNFAQRTKFEITEVARQLIYCYHREQDSIPGDLLQKFNEYVVKEEIEVEDYYSGFNGEKFDPFEGFDGLIFEVFQRDQSFMRDAINFYRVRQVLRMINFKIEKGYIDSLYQWYDKARQIINEFEAKFGKDALAGIKIEMLIQAKENRLNHDLLRAFIGIKSLIGKKKFTASNKPTILGRMVGCKNPKTFNYYSSKESNVQKSILPTLKKYGKRYQMDKMLLDLAERKFIMFLSKKSATVIYLSKYMEPEELGKIVKRSTGLKDRIREAASKI